MLTKRFNYLFNSVLLIVAGFAATGQSLSLDSCYRLAEINNPLKANEEHISTMFDLDRLNNWVTNFPNLMLSGSATYQSDVFTLPISAPGFELPDIPKDQYRLAIEVSQKLYDGGLSRSKLRAIEAEQALKEAELKVSLYQTKEMVTTAFFGVLLLRENLKILQSVREELNNQVQRSQAGYDQGILLKSVLNTLEIERLKNEQNIKALHIQLAAFYDLLSRLTGEDLDTAIVLITPDIDAVGTEIQRPELNVFRSRSSQLSVRGDQLSAGRKPKITGFANIGYAQPNPLNFFETDPSEYYIVGLKMEWLIWDWKRTRRSQERLDIGRQLVQNQKEHFVQQMDLRVIRKNAEIEELRNVIEVDEKIVLLQEQIIVESRKKFESGVMTASDFISVLNEQSQGLLTLSRHKTELARSRTELLYLTGELK